MATIDYNKQAIDFLKSTNTKITIGFAYKGHYFYDDEITNTIRDVYNVTIENDKHCFAFQFGQSLNQEGIKPNEYDILSTITKDDPYSLEDFCSEYGYDPSDEDIVDLYEKVQEEYDNICLLWNGDEFAQLTEIN